LSAAAVDADFSSLDVGLPYRGSAPDLGAFEAGASGASAFGPVF